jgi:endoglucanase
VNGLSWFGDWGTLRYATGAALSAALLFDVTGDASYRSFAESQLAYVLGDNEYGRSFLIGYGTNPPTQPHHRNAYGYDAFDPERSHRFSLAGALVGGPTKEDTEVSAAGYEDTIGNYVGNEVTIDYNTGLVGLAAFAVAHERRP